MEVTAWKFPSFSSAQLISKKTTIKNFFPYPFSSFIEMYFNQNSKPALHYVLHSLIPKPKSSQRKALFQSGFQISCWCRHCSSTLETSQHQSIKQVNQSRRAWGPVGHIYHQQTSYPGMWWWHNAKHCHLKPCNLLAGTSQKLRSPGPASVSPSSNR